MSTNDLAAKIAELIAAENDAGELSRLRSAIERLESRLDRLESAETPAETSHVPVHPSAQHFAIAEAIADKVFENAKGEKACAFEPNGKPCDHCSMCNSRGF